MNKITTFFCAFSFAFAASISLVACGDDSSSASNDEQPGSSSDEIASSSSVMGDGCNAENEGEVKVEWVGNPKYGYDTYKRCKNGSWVDGDISLTCDTAGVQVGDTCVTHPSQNIFQAGMNPAAGELIFVYKGDGVWERDNQAQIDSLIERQNRRDAAMKEYCGEPESGKFSECCYPVPDEFAADYADNIASILYTSEPDSDDWDLQEYFENKNCVMDAEEAIIEE